MNKPNCKNMHPFSSLYTSFKERKQITETQHFKVSIYSMLCGRKHTIQVLRTPIYNTQETFKLTYLYTYTFILQFKYVVYIYLDTLIGN